MESIQRQRIQMMLDIEHDLGLIKNRLNMIEDYFDDEGIIAQLSETVHRLAIKIEALEAAQDDK